MFSWELKRRRRVIYKTAKIKEKKTGHLDLIRCIKNEKQKDLDKREEIGDRWGYILNTHQIRIIQVK